MRLDCFAPTGLHLTWPFFPVIPLDVTANMDISNNAFEEVAKKVCKIGVFEEGEMIEFRADCAICECNELCHTCTENESVYSE